MQIGSHARRMALVLRPERTITDLRTLDAQTDESEVHTANAGVHHFAVDPHGIGFAIERVGHFRLADSVGQTSLIPPQRFGVERTNDLHLHHAAHRRSESCIGGDLLTLESGKRFTRSLEQLDSVLALHVRARVVTQEGGLRATPVFTQTAERVFIDATHDRIGVGANGTILGVEWSGSHSR